MVYVRQSTTKQLLVHQERTRRQYQLAERAAQLGWPHPRIVVLDEDLGRSGASSKARLGFQRLVSAIGLGEVGLVLVTEVSRLSRLNSDWHRVLELCAVFGTLIADDEGIYDPRDPNDRLVLGLKGTLFAAELHILQARMRAGLLNKARRGALVMRLPVGYRRLHDGTVVFDPDEQVQWTLRTLFDRFAVQQNARAVQRSFQAEGLLMPRYVQEGTDSGRLVWVTPTYQMLTQVLTSPVYAGMFVYGRRVQQTRPGDPTERWAHRLPKARVGDRRLGRVSRLHQRGAVCAQPGAPARQLVQLHASPSRRTPRGHRLVTRTGPLWGLWAADAGPVQSERPALRLP
jgi:DNA invertase Pin-like site-specific DNA recombinase